MTLKVNKQLLKPNKLLKANRPLIFLLLVLLLVLLLIPFLSKNVSAASIGISPGRVDFNNVLKNGYAERFVLLSTASPDNLELEYVIDGEIKDWITLQPDDKTFNLSQAAPLVLKVIVEPPNDVENRIYRGTIRFLTKTVKSPTGTHGVSVRVSVLMEIVVSITGDQIRSCRAGITSFRDTEVNYPIEYSVNVRNTGNVRITPTIEINILDQQLKTLLLSKEYTFDEILPTTERLFERKIIEHNLKPGQYWIDTRVRECDQKDFLTFDVLEKGAVSDKGHIVKVENLAWIYVGDTTPIRVYFSNEGSREIKAVYKGEILLDNKFIQKLETDEVAIAPGETVILLAYFTPKEPGRYELTGRGYYSNKITFEKGAIINVNPSKNILLSYTNIISLSIYLIIVITIVVLVRKIISLKTKS